ncbi:MAG: sensor domain-containing diguanylate cyclase [Thermodesulfovibrionales bacterium]|nr:sensor domain-containing diguanylate cyclase [Thermodesulfovibrionales bacterium]
MGKEIVIYEKNEGSLGFLRNFFKKRNDYSAIFIKDEKSLLGELNKKKAAALIVGSSVKTGEIKLADTGCPVIAMVAGDITNGIRSIMKRDIDIYLISPFHEEDFEHKLKVAIEKRGWVENICRDKKELETIVDLTYLVSSTLDPKEVLYFVVKKIAELIDVTRCSMISIPCEEKRHAYVVSSFEDPKTTNIKLELKKYPEIRKALSSRNTVFIKDALKDPLMRKVRPVLAPLGIRSIVVIPIIFRNEVIGTLFLRTSRAGHTFTEREIRLCNAIANAATNALYNAFIYEKLENEKTKLEKFAITDYLTGIYNIRYFYHRLEAEFSRSQRYKAPLSCIMFDIDYFKKVNDTYGHRVGDMVLREFAQFVKKHTRKSDVFARYGGEEFIMLLTQTSDKGAMAEAERLRYVIKEHRFKSLKNKKGITASIGVASYPHKKIKTQDDLITFADNALFAAKNSGRDQIRAWNQRSA